MYLLICFFLLNKMRSDALFNFLCLIYIKSLNQSSYKNFSYENFISLINHGWTFFGLQLKWSI